MDPLTGDGDGPANIAGRLAGLAAAHSDRPAIIQGRGRRRREVSFGDLAQRVAGLGTKLRSRGLQPGDRALLFVPMSIDLYVSLLGVLHAGGVAVFVDAWAGRRRLEQAVAAAGPRAFIGSPRAHLLRLIVPSLRRVPVRLWSLGRLGEVGGEAGRAAEVRSDDHALVTFTTGTTGRPKAAARSHRFLWAQHQVLARHLGLRENDIDMPTLPVFVLNNLALGVTTVLPDFDPRRPADIDPAGILDQMRDEGVTTTSGSPSIYQRLVEHLERHGDGGRIPVRVLFTGGAPVFPPLARRLVRWTAGEVRVLYGSTEAEPIAEIGAEELVEAASDPGAMGVCAGEPVPEVGWKIVRPVDGSIRLESAERSVQNNGWQSLEVAPGETGELLVTGPHVLRGYLDDPTAEAASKVRDGDRVWHRTGDGARWDGRRLWLMGRVSQRVRRQGSVWWSMAAESRAIAVPGVAHAAYLGVPAEAEAPEDSAVLCLELESDGGSRAGAPVAELEAEVRAALDPIPVDRMLVFDRLPRDPRHASKTDLGRLRELLEERLA